MSGKRPNGDGCIYAKTVKKSGKEYHYWAVQITIGQNEKGKPIRKEYLKPYTAEGKAELLQQMHGLFAEYHTTGKIFEPSKLTVSEWFDEWIEQIEYSVKYHTLKQYKSNIENHIKPELGKYRLADVKKAQIQDFIKKLSKVGKTVIEKDSKGRQIVRQEPLSAKSIKNIHGILSAAFGKAEELEYVRKNPATGITLPRIEKKPITPLTGQEIAELLERLKTDSYKDVLTVILFSGMRIAEALGLLWEDVNFEQGTVTIKGQLFLRDGTYSIEETKSSNIRVITLAPFVVQLLRDIHKKQEQDRQTAGEHWQGWTTPKEQRKAFVFTDKRGNHLAPRTIEKHYRKIADELELSGKRVHDLRHTYATISLMNGDDIKTVQTNLGHATAAFTLNVYGHATQQMKAESANRMEQFYSSLSKTQNGQNAEQIS